MTAEEWFIEGRSRKRTREDTIAFLQRIMDSERRLAVEDSIRAIVELDGGAAHTTRSNILCETIKEIRKLIPK